MNHAETDAACKASGASRRSASPALSRVPSRRVFLAKLAALGSMAALAGFGGRLEMSRRRRFNGIGLAMYTVRQLAARDFEGTLRTIADIGYRDLDMYPDVGGLPPRETRALLDRFGLACRSSRVTTAALRGDLARAIETGNILGARWLTLANVPAPERTSVSDWERLIGTINNAAETARRGGLTLCYHNHDFELRPVEGRLPFEMLLNGTDADRVRLQMDVYWMTKGGRNPADEIARLGARVATLHLKDMDATPARGITTVGWGTIDFAAVLRAARAAGVGDVFVEEDEPEDPMAAARQSHAHLTRLRY